MNNQKTEQTAHQNATAKVEFRIHLTTYIVVVSLLAIINITLSPKYIWFKWPLMGWGIGIALHALNVYYSENTSIKERIIKKEMTKNIQARDEKIK